MGGMGRSICSTGLKSCVDERPRAHEQAERESQPGPDPEADRDAQQRDEDVVRQLAGEAHASQFPAAGSNASVGRR